jgi:hypothetical protein
MSHSNFFKEDLELDQLRADEVKLLKLEKEYEASHSRIARERSEQERTMPPLEEIRNREKRKNHEQIVSRGEVANVRRDQNRSLLMLILLVTATCTLVWWGMKLMQGG